MRICPQCQTETDSDVCPVDGYRTVLKPTKAQRTDLSGTTFQGRYRIEEQLGSGGMGAVYRATQLSVDRPVALKVIHAKLADNLSDVARFQQEARAIAALHHPNIVSLIDFGQADSGELFLVMEHLEGMSLGRLIRHEAPLSAERVIHISRQIFEALHQAHSRDIVHRDMKPENIFVSTMGRKGDFVKLLDFGIAKVNKNEHSALSTITQTGTIVGSPRYMAPEQARGREVTGQTDLYAVGAMMYEMVTGKPVFDAESATDCVIMHVTEAPPRPVVGGQYVSGPLIGLILGLLEKDPASRPPGAEVCLQQLESMGERAMFSVGPADASERVRRPSDVLRDGETPAGTDDMPMTMTLGEWRGAMDPTVATPSPLPDIDTRRAITSAELGITEAGVKRVEGVSGAEPAPKAATGFNRVLGLVAAIALLTTISIVAMSGGDENIALESAAQDAAKDVSSKKVAQAAKDEPDSTPAATEVSVTRPVVTVQKPSTPVAKPLAAAGLEEVPEPKRGSKTILGSETPKEPEVKAIKRELASRPTATVFLDGKRLGKTPQVIHWMSNEPAPKVKLIRAGYKPLTVEMEASSEGISQRVTMKRRQSQGPKKVFPGSKKKAYHFID